MRIFTQFGRLTVAAGSALAILAPLTASLAFAPVAHAAGERCFSRSFDSSVKIDRKFQTDDHISYGASYHWCATDGKVTSFVVDSTFGEDAGVKVDIRPYHPLAWGPTYPIFINGSKGGFIDHNTINLQAGGTAGQL
jgi:hypothetical protein